MYTSIKFIMSLTTILDWILYQMDVKKSFLNGLIEEKIYIKQEKRFEVHGLKTHFCKLKKALYGLKQAPHAWYSRVDDHMLGLDFTKKDVDSNIYYLVDHSNLLVLVSRRFYTY